MTKKSKPAKDDVATIVYDETMLRANLEALLFAADEPITSAEIAKVFEGVPEGLLGRVIQQMRLEWAGPNRGVHIVEIAGGIQFRTNPDCQDTVLKLHEAKPVKLSRAALETLAIIAYRQPVTRAMVDDIRGVDSSGMVKKLTDLELVEVVGKMDDIGRPNLYGTTRRFLQFFGLSGIHELPTLEEFEVELDELLYEDNDEKEVTEEHND